MKRYTVKDSLGYKLKEFTSYKSAFEYLIKYQRYDWRIK